MRSIGSVALLCLATTTASAAPGLTLEPGHLFVQLDLELNVSKDNIGKPFSIAPDVSIGATHD
ncbi:MAG TPA: hypothetical protein VFQ65_02235, partial [Kofleriaceae bacterium]|nr:hypothetical protein [Kofleriaceae bacterium]